MQENALHQAQQDLRAARAREGLPLEVDPLDEVEPFEAAHREAEARRIPQVVADPGALAKAIIAAGERRRGVGPPEPPSNAVLPVRVVSAAEIIAAAEKRDQLAKGKKP